MIKLRRVISSGTVLLMILTIFATVGSAIPTVTRNISSENVSAGGAVDVTITFTATENLQGFPMIVDVVPTGWNVDHMTATPGATKKFDTDGEYTVSFLWGTINSGTSVTVSYKLHAPADAGGVYTLHGNLTNGGEPYAGVTGQSNVVVGSPDETFPSVTNPTATPNAILLSELDNADLAHTNTTLSVNVFAAGGVKSVVIDLSSIGGSPARPMTNTGGNVWSVNTSATGTLGSKSLAINATGNNGKSNTSIIISLNVLRNGDVDGNGVVNFLGDALYLVRNTRGVPGYALVNPLVADVDGSGSVDFLGDALYLVRHTRGLPGYEMLK